MRLAHMLRDGLDANARHASIMVTTDGKAKFRASIESTRGYRTTWMLTCDGCAGVRAIR